MTAFIILTIMPFMSCTYISTSLIYKAPPDAVIDTAYIPDSAVITSKEGERVVTGLFYKGDSTLVVLFHGNNGTINNELQCARWFSDRGRSVLLPEYPGFGVSSRYSPNEKNIYADSASLIRFIQETFRFDAEKTIVVGRSLGAAVATEMATRNLGWRLILITPFSSMNEMFIQKGAPRILVPFINNQRYNNQAKAKAITIPTLIVGSSDDAVIPLSMAKELRKQLNDASLIIVKSSSHGSIYNDFPEEVIARMVSF